MTLHCKAAKALKPKTREPLVREFMTLQPKSVEGNERIAAASQVMARFGIHHLPVTMDGIVVGVLSDRELNVALGAERSGAAARRRVIDACYGKPYFVHPDTPLREVAEVMAKEHLGSAVVMENAHLSGIFTAADACRALHALLGKTIGEPSLDHVRRRRSFSSAFRGAR